MSKSSKLARKERRKVEYHEQVLKEKEEMLETRNYYGKMDLTPYRAIEHIKRCEQERNLTC